MRRAFQGPEGESLPSCERRGKDAETSSIPLSLTSNSLKPPTIWLGKIRCNPPLRSHPEAERHLRDGIRAPKSGGIRPPIPPINDTSIVSIKAADSASLASTSHSVCPVIFSQPLRFTVVAPVPWLAALKSRNSRDRSSGVPHPKDMSISVDLLVSEGSGLGF